MKKSQAKLKTTTSLILNVLLYVFLVICMISVSVTLLSKKDDDGAELFGYQMRIVISESMAKSEGTDVSKYDIKSIPLNSMVFIQTVPDDPKEAEKWYSKIEVGDVLTFKYLYARQETITHRVVDKLEKPGGGYIFSLEGDNKASGQHVMTQVIDTTDTNSPNYIIGKVTAKSFLFGLFISLMQQPAGIVLVVIVPCFIIIMMEVFKIIGVINEDKKKKALEETRKKNDEIEELRRRLAAFENQTPAAATAGASTAESDAPATSDAVTEDEKTTDQQISVEEGKQ